MRETVSFRAPAAGGRNTSSILLSGIRMGSLGLFLQCATSTVFSLLMNRLVSQFGSRWVYISSMVSFTISALVICLSQSVVLVTFMAALTGFAYATLQTLPYTLTCHYYQEKEVSTFMKEKRNCVEKNPSPCWFKGSSSAFRSTCQKRKPKACRRGGL